MKTLTLGALLFLAMAGSVLAETVTVPVSLTLDPVAATAPGINNILVTLDGGLLGTDSDQMELSGTTEVLVRIDISDRDNPVVTGLQFVSADIAGTDLSFTLFVLFISDLMASGTGLGLSLETPSGSPELVTADMFDAGLHTLTFNEGMIAAMGTVLGNPVNESVDLATDPITQSGAGTGATSIANPGSTLLSHDYEISVAVPYDFTEPVEVAPGAFIDLIVEGTFAATGTVTIYHLPDLDPVRMTAGGFELDLSGEDGAEVILKATDALTGFTDILGPFTSPVTITDPGALTRPSRYYRVEAPF